MDYERPVLRCIVSYPIENEHIDPWTDPALVTLEIAAELSAKGYVVMVDFQDQQDLAMWERFQRAAIVTTKGGRKFWEPPR